MTAGLADEAGWLMYGSLQTGRDRKYRQQGGKSWAFLRLENRAEKCCRRGSEFLYAILNWKNGLSGCHETEIHGRFVGNEH